MALANLGSALFEAGRFEEAISTSQDAAAIAQETGDRHGKGKALANLGVVLGETGRFEEAITASQDAAAIFRENGDRHGEGMALNAQAGPGPAGGPDPCLPGTAGLQSPRPTRRSVPASDAVLGYYPRRGHPGHPREPPPRGHGRDRCGDSA